MKQTKYTYSFLNLDRSSPLILTLFSMEQNYILHNVLAFYFIFQALWAKKEKKAVFLKWLN